MKKIFVFLLGCLSFYFLSGCVANDGFMIFDSESPPPLPINHPDLPSEVSKTLGQEGIQTVGSRFYIRSFLEVIFSDPNSATNNNKMVDILDAYLGSEFEDGGTTNKKASFDYIHIFGGACDYYSEAGSGKACANNRSNIYLKNNVASTSSREAVRVRMCVDLTNEDVLVTAALAKVGLLTSDIRSGQKIKLVYSLFYPGEEMSAELSSSFLELISQMSQANETSVNQWRMILFTLCRSPDWQIY